LARPPSLLIDSATAAAAGPLISASITAAPSLANKRAVTSPKPEPPPVIIATFSANRMMYPQLQHGQRPTPCTPSQGCGTRSLSGTISAFLLPHLEQTHSSGGRVPARTNPWNLCLHSGHSNVKTGITHLQVCDACFNIRMPGMQTQVPGISPGGNAPAGGMGLLQMRQQEGGDSA